MKDKKEEKKVEKKEDKKEKKSESSCTDILEKYYYDEKEKIEKVKRIYMDGDKKIKEEISNS